TRVGTWRMSRQPPCPTLSGQTSCRCNAPPLAACSPAPRANSAVSREGLGAIPPRAPSERRFSAERLQLPPRPFRFCTHGLGLALTRLPLRGGALRLPHLPAPGPLPPRHPGRALRGERQFG